MNDPIDITPEANEPVDPVSNTEQILNEATKPSAKITKPLLMALLTQCREVFDELISSVNIGTVDSWEFGRARAHRPDAKILTQTKARIEAVVGPRPKPVTTPDGTPKLSGVRYNN